MDSTFFCPHCGAPNPVGAAVCAQCGAVLPAVPQSAASPSSVPEKADASHPDSAAQTPPPAQGQPFADQPAPAADRAQMPNQATAPSGAYGQPEGAPPYQPPYQPHYTYGKPLRPHAPQFPFGQIDRPFGQFEGYFVPGTLTPIRSRITAAVLCLLLGPFGIHKFYVGQWGAGIVSLFLLITLGRTGWIWALTYALSLVESILLFTMSNEDFQNRYHVRSF